MSKPLLNASDRYIPNSINEYLFALPFSQSELDSEKSKSDPIRIDDVKKLEARKSYDQLCHHQILFESNYYSHSPRNNSILRFQRCTNVQDSSFYLKEEFSLKKRLSIVKSPIESQFEKQTRRFPSKPFKILEIPNVQDDFYLNLLDWSYDNLIGIALEKSVYIWNAMSSKAQRYLELSHDNLPSSLAFSPRNSQIAIGDSEGVIRIVDLEKKKSVRFLDIHKCRIGCLAWNGNCLTSGSRDKKIHNADLREKAKFNFTLIGHSQEVCGLKWSFDDQHLASGGNDNKVFIWSLKKQEEIVHFTDHKAAVKALCWSPHQHSLLASGGGTSDKTIRLWNSSLRKCVRVVETNSQVCNMIFSKTLNELVSTHGFSNNQISIWNVRDMELLGNLTGHKKRVIYLAMSPDGQTIVSGSADESLRFWNIFPSIKGHGSSLDHSSLSNVEIR